MAEPEHKTTDDFETFWQGIEPDLSEDFFMVEKSENIKNLCWLTWIAATKSNE